jgi:hypothetical protein
MNKVAKNGICSFSLLVFFVSILVQTSGEEMFLFPKILSLLGILFSVFVFLYDLKHPEEYPGNGFLALGGGGFLLAAMIGAQWIGFFTMLFVISVGLYSFLRHCCGIGFVQGIKRTLVNSLAICLVLYVLFKILLQIQVPVGILI